MGIPTEILWEWDGNGNEDSLPTATLCNNTLINSTNGLVDEEEPYSLVYSNIFNI